MAVPDCFGDLFAAPSLTQPDVRPYNLPRSLPPHTLRTASHFPHSAMHGLTGGDVLRRHAPVEVHLTLTRTTEDLDVDRSTGEAREVEEE